MMRGSENAVVYYPIMLAIPLAAVGESIDFSYISYKIYVGF